MQWTILGAGAIGSLLATQLQSSGESVNLLDLRRTHHTANASMGIELNDGIVHSAFASCRCVPCRSYPTAMYCW